jgi:hypothetical protein
MKHNKHIKEHIRKVWNALTGSHNLGETSKAIFNFVGNCIWPGWGHHVSGSLASFVVPVLEAALWVMRGKKTDYRFDYCRLIVCLSVSVNPEAVWRLRWFYDPFFNYINSLAPLTCSHLTFIQTRALLFFHRHILLYSLRLVYNTNRSALEWKDRHFKRINCQLPRGNKQGINFTWNNIPINKNVILSRSGDNTSVNWGHQMLPNMNSSGDQ